VTQEEIVANAGAMKSVGAFARRLTTPDGFLALVLGVSIAANVYQTWQIRLMQQHIQAHEDEHRGPAAATAGAALNEGMTAPAITAKDLRGQTVVVDFPRTERPTILYVFTPRCVWCQRNLRNLKALEATAGDRYRLIALSLSLDDLQEYATTNQPKYPIYAEPSRETKAAYGFRTTPHTMIIAPGGEVLKSWTGAYRGATETEVAQYFGVTLPGLSEIPGTDLAPAARAASAAPQ
jgi:peroxiredoxin